MTTQQIAERLVVLCREVKNLQAVDELYGPNIESVESQGDETMPKVMNGIEAVRGKNIWYFDNHDIHSVRVDEPLVTDTHFCVRMSVDATLKPTGRRVSMSELAVYEVEGGKIVREHFFYRMG
ncbi:MAG TPA: nuclear transport factor 2 family protein [Tepidisphaeraceae bacterium]|jgi:ketosteroid isomerase-like protein